MKKLELLILQAIALFCSYIIISTAFVSALDIRIVTSTGQELSGSVPKFTDLIQKDLTYPYDQNLQYINMRLSSKNPSYIIKKVYLFRCKSMDPNTCIANGINPVISVNSGASGMVFDETYKWNDVNSNNICNFLTFVKLDVNGKEVWTGSWDKTTKTGIRNFYAENNEADRIDVYLKPGVTGDTVKSYMDNYYSIPSDRINRSVFSTVSGSAVSKFYDMSGSKDIIDPSGTGIPSFYHSEIQGSVFNKSISTWDFVLPGGDKIANPITFYSTAAGPPVTGGASLIVDNWSPQITTCWSDEAISASMHADNATMGYYQSYYYTTDDVRAGDGSITCSIINPNASIYSYQCSMPVSKFPVCASPGTSTIKVYFNYAGGVQLYGSFPVTLKSPNPQLVVSSIAPTPFDCGIDEKLTARLQIANPLQGVPKTSYSFDGKNFNALNCTGSASNYECTIGEGQICPLLQENLELTFKFTYGDVEVVSAASEIFMTFPPPSLGIDTVTPQAVEAGEITKANVLLHVNYPDFITYNERNFNYKYLNNVFQPIPNCSLESSYSNIKYYTCPVSLDISGEKQGIETLSFRLDGFQEGKTKQLTANSFFEIIPSPPEPKLQIISTSSPLSCIQDPSLLITARADNIQGSPQTYYSTDSGKTYKPLTCSSSAGEFSCAIAKNDLCSLMSNSITLLLKFVYPSKDLISSPQNVYIDLPEPHMQVYSINPDTLSSGAKNNVSASLYIQYPEMVGDNPVFLYSYLAKTNQKMTCAKVSSTSIRDFYDCTNIQFEIPEDYQQASLPVMFSIQGTTISFPMAIPVSSLASLNAPWLEIISSNPARIEIEQGNQTQASFYVTVHNAAENNLKHEATLLTNQWVSSGSCKEASVDYDFTCDTVIKVPKTTNAGQVPVNLTLRMSDGSRNYDVSNQTNVYVLPQEMGLEIQSISPDTLYCEGQTQQNPGNVRVTAAAKNMASPILLEEDIGFNGQTIVHSARYCTQQGQTISCNIPSDQILGKVRCGEGELAPGGGSHYYPLSLSFLVKIGNEQTTVAGTKDIAIAARPLQPYLEIADNDVVDGALQTPINCLVSRSIKLGDTGYVRIMYADLLHAEPKEGDLSWTFRLDAQDDQGKLTKGMGVSPEANATICKFREYQRVGVHRIEDYECSLYLSNKMFQRCANGEGDLLLTATSGGKKAEASIDARIVKDSSLYQIQVEVLSGPAKDIDCQTQGYGQGVPCSLASDSNQNVTLRIYNANANVEVTDLNVYGFDVKMTGTTVSAGERSLGNCQKDSSDPSKYVCPFQIGPVIRLPNSIEYNVTNNPRQTSLPDIELGATNASISIKYANNLIMETKSVLDGTITIHPKKSNSQINAEAMREKMAMQVKSFTSVFKGVVTFLAYCGVCAAGTTLINRIENTKKSGTGQGLSCNAAQSTTQPPKPGIQPTATYCKDCCSTCVSTGKPANECSTFICEGCDCSSASLASDTGYQPETGAGHISFQSGTQATDKSKTDWWCYIIGIVLGVATVYGTMKLLGMSIGGDEENQTNDMGKALEKGIKWGFATCVLPQIVGRIGDIFTKEGTKADNIFEGVATFGEKVGETCSILMGMMPLIINFISFYISFLQYEACMDNVQNQLEYSSAAAANAPGVYGATAEAATAANTMTQMMGCYSTLLQGFERLSCSMSQMSSTMSMLGGSGSSSFVVHFKSQGPLANDAYICGTGELQAIATGYCKGGTQSTSLEISHSGEMGCNPTQNPQTQPCNYGNLIAVPFSSLNMFGSSGSCAPTQTQPQSSGQVPIRDTLGNTCNNGLVTITIRGYETKTTTLHYVKSLASATTDAEKAACSGQQQTQVAKAGLGEECDNNKPCSGSLVCCYQNHNEVNVKKRCVNLPSSCACVKTDGINGYCKTEDYQKNNPSKCETPSTWCADPSYKYCCT